jgi:xylose isomerase
MAAQRSYQFSFGPWNISQGADPFGPPVRKEVAFAAKIREYKKLGFDAVQFHDDDVVPPDLIDSDPATLQKTAAKVKKLLDGEGLFCEIIAPRLWEHPKTIDGGYTSNNPAERKYAIERSKRCIDIGNAVGCKNLVLWLAREGTYVREAKDPIIAAGRICDAVNAMLEHDAAVRILGEMKPNEPMDQAYLPTPGHFLAMCYKVVDPKRCGVLIESALLDPGRARPLRRPGLCPVAPEALERASQRSKRSQIRPGQDLWLGRPPASVQHRLGTGARRI